jgi:hypothetical protein
MFSGHPVIEFMWWLMLGVAALGLICWILSLFLDGYNHFKSKREVEKICRDAVRDARIEDAKREAEDAAPKPWIY